MANKKSLEKILEVPKATVPSPPTVAPIPLKVAEVVKVIYTGRLLKVKFTGGDGRTATFYSDQPVTIRDETNNGSKTIEAGKLGPGMLLAEGRVDEVRPA